MTQTRETLAGPNDSRTSGKKYDMLPRPDLRYHSDGHPILSQRTIESYAEMFLDTHFPGHTRTPGPLLPAALISLLNEKDGVVTTCDDLGSDGPRKRLGRMYLKRKLVVLDHVLFTTRQISLPFVVAHELAHWLLHRDCRITSIRENEQFPDDNEDTERIGALGSAWTSLGRIEWQASKLAGALLIPRQAAINSIWALQSDLSIPRRKGIIYENPTAGSRAESGEQLRKLAEIFQVSETVTRIRLTGLGLYHQQIPDVSRIGKAQNPFSVFPRM